MLRRRLLLSAALLLSSRPGLAELRPMPVVSYGPERGLSGHAITAIAQDRAGRLWAGTWGGGVFRYDGLEWRPITSRDGLLSDRVIGLVAGSRGEMWVSLAAAPGSAGGLSIVQGDRVLPVEGSHWETTTGMEASDGSIWLALRGGGAARFVGGLLERVPGLAAVDIRAIAGTPDQRIWFLGRPPGGDPSQPGTLHRHDATGLNAVTPADGLPVAPLHAMHVDRDGVLWIAGGAGLHRVRGDRVEPAEAEGATLARPLHSLSEDADGRLWLGAGGAVLVVDRGRVSELALPSELSAPAVLAVQAAPTGGVFLMTSGHLLRLEGKIAEVLALEARAGLISAANESEALSLESALDAVAEHESPLLLDHEGGVWAIAGNRLVRYAGDEARRFGRDEGLPSEDVQALMVDSKGFVHAGTAAGLARLDPALGYFEPVSGIRGPVSALYEDRGSMVYAAAADGVHRLEQLRAQPWAPAEAVREPTTLASDAAGSLWIGAADGLFRVTAEGLERAGFAAGATTPPVRALRDVEGELWIGHDAGLMQRVGERFESLPAFNGVRVRGILVREDAGAHRVLAVTQRGLLEAPGATPAFGNIERTALSSAWIDRSGTLWQALELGLLASSGGAEILHAGGSLPAEPIRAFAEDSDGRIWMATRRGLFRHAPRRRPPTVWIDSVRIGGERADLLAAPLRVAGECRSLEIRWAGVSFIGPRDAADLRFETRLLPVEKGWTAATRARERQLAAPSADRYTFEVRALSRDLVRSEPARIEIVVGRDEELPQAPRLILPDVARP